MKRYRALVVCSLFFSACLLFSSENSAQNTLRDLAQLRQHTNTARLEALLKILQDRSIPYKLETFDSKASPHGRTKGTNVVITFGSAPGEIVVGAHYDALEYFQGGMSDGMIDNGAAAITLVGLAEALKSRSLHHRVLVVLFDLEEIGMVGSKAFVAAHKSEISAAVNLDVSGFGDSFIYGYGTAAGTEQLRKIFKAECDDRLLTCAESPAFPHSDDLSFQDVGIPVLSIAMLPRVMMYQTWLFLNGGNDSGLGKGFMPKVLKILHTPEDNIGMIEPAAMDQELQVILDTLLRLDATLK